MTQVNNTSSRIVIEVGSQFHEIAGLDHEVSINRPEGRELPTCDLVVHNITPANIRSMQTEGGRVFVYATVDDVEYTLFTGNVASVVAEYEGVDLRTDIMVTDARNNMKTKVKLSYPAGKRIADVVRDVCGQAGMTVQTIESPFADAVFESSYAYSGTARRALDQLTKRAGAIWRVHDGQVSIGTRESLSRRTGMRYTADTGMIGSPKLLDDGKMQLEAILSPQITNGSIIQVQSQFVDGWYRVESHTHQFGSRDAVWTTTIECKEA